MRSLGPVDLRYIMARVGNRKTKVPELSTPSVPRLVSDFSLEALRCSDATE